MRDFGGKKKVCGRYFVLIIIACILCFWGIEKYRNALPEEEKQIKQEGISRTDAAEYSSSSREYRLSEIGSGSVVTPQQFGAKADGIHDDAPALQAALESGQAVILISDLYLFSDVSVWDCDVSLNGNGYVLYCDGCSMEICALRNEDPDSDAAVVTENKPYFGTYYRGYVSYHGEKPIDADLDECTVFYFNEHHAFISNLVILCRNAEGKCGLTLKRMCKSLVNNVSVICENGSDGEVGILIYHCYQTNVENCYAQNWTADTTCNRGYGIEAYGNDITISGCSAYGNKHDICICSGRDIISNNITVKDCKVGCQYDPDAYRKDGSRKYQARFDIHASGKNVVVQDLDITVENADAGTIFAVVRSPEAVIDGLNAKGEDGYISFGELADKVYFTNLQMPDMKLYGGFSEEESVQEIHITNGSIKGIDKMHPDAKIYFKNVLIDNELLGNENEGVLEKGFP